MNTTNIEFWRLVIAAVLGIAIGLERTHAHKTAGMRTYALVSMGACLLVILGETALPGVANANPFLIASSIVTGIGFLCGGVIIFQNHQLSGLTTAAGLWLTAGVGIAVGFGEVTLAVFATCITLVVLTVLWFVEKIITKATDQPRK